LLEEGLFVDAAQEVGVSHIFCGHTHVPKGRYKAACNPSVEVHRAGTATQRFSRNAIHLVDVRVNGDKVEQVGWTDLFWDREEKLFRP
jgi:hypothetical protein